MTECKPSAEATDRSVYLTLHRVIDAPVEAVYAAWTEPDMLRRWLAPGGATVVRAVAEAAVGGTFLIEMRGWTDGLGSPAACIGTSCPTVVWCRHGAGRAATSRLWSPSSSSRTRPGGTRLTLTHSRFAHDEARDEHVQGWIGCLAKLEKLWAG